jgi:hypothetical protein
MVYFSHSVGAGAGTGSMRPTFGLRVQQVQQVNNTGDPEQSDPMRHRELINWQMDGRSNLHLSNMRVKLGNKLTYDFSSQRFGAPGRGAIQLGTPSMRNGTPSFATSRSFAGRSPETGRTPADRMGVALAARELNAGSVRDANSGRDTSNFREIAVAAMSAIGPARITVAQRQVAQRQAGGGLSGVIAAQRLHNATALR